MSDASSTPNPVDIHVGARVKSRRKALGISQEKLGEHLGVSFQQVQKYEKGTNRMGASRLHEISLALKTPVEFFFDGLGEQAVSGSAGFSEVDPEAYLIEFMATKEGAELQESFNRIEDPIIRKRILELVKALCRETDPVESN